MFKSILVVCTGNICRSPIGERLLRRALPEIKIDSAGVGALVGKPADKTAIIVAQRHGVSLDDHQGRQFSSELGRQYDLILAMDKTHIERITHLAPEIRGKTMLFAHWLNQREIPDPYRKSEEAFESVYEMIKQASQRWAEKIGS